MTERKVYIGSFGPFLFDDTDSIDDPDGDFSGMSYKGLVTDGGIIMGSMDLLDTDASNVLSLVWNEDDTADRTLSILVGGGDRSIELNENLAIADGFDITLQALGQANSLILNESLTVGDGHAGTLTFSTASKTLTVEDVSVLNQDLTTDASPTFKDLALSEPSDIYALSHDSFADFEEAEHFTMLDEDDMASNSDTQAATQQSVKAYVDYSVTSLGASYYMLDTSSGVSDYKLCSLTPSEDVETYLEAADLSDNDYIGGWISDTGETPDILLTGNFNFYITAEKTTGTKTLKLYWKMYERKSDTSEVLIATSSITNEVTDKDTFVLPFLLTSDYIPASTSRIVGKIYASVSGGGNAPTVRIYYRGNTAARWDIPANSEVFRNIFVPYANAVQDVDLNGHSITGIDNITVADESWIGIGASDERIVFDTAGNISFMGCNVGIGTTNPDYLLHILSNSGGPQVGIETSSGIASFVVKYTGGKFVEMGRAGSDGSSISYDSSGFFSIGMNNVPGESGLDTVVMRFDNNGNVGIGTTTPRKQIDSLSTSQAQLRLSYSDNSVYADFQVGSTGELDITPNGSAPNVDITTHDGSSQGLKLGGTLITKNAAEINDLVEKSLFDADTFLYASTDNTPVATSPTNVMAALSGHAAAAFDFNSQNLTGVGGILTKNGGYFSAVKTLAENHFTGLFIGRAGPWSEYQAYGADITFGNSNTYDASVMARIRLRYDGSGLMELTDFYDGGYGASGVLMSLRGNGNVDISQHDGSTIGLKLGGTLVTARAEELNQLDDNTLTNHLTLFVTDTDGDTEGDIWYDASEKKLKLKTATGVETVTSG